MEQLPHDALVVESWQTFRADAMAKIGLRVLFDIGFQTGPLAMLSADFLTPRAGG